MLGALYCGDLLFVFPYVPVAHVFQENPKVLSKSPTFQHTHTLWLSSVWWFMPSIYANYQLRYALLEYRLGCLRGCPGGGGEQIGRTQATHGQLPFESSIARETGAKKTMRRASFERYFGGRIRGIFLCAWIPLRSASQPTSQQRTPNPRDVVCGERWWIPTAAISVVLMCGVVSSVYMRLKQIFNFFQHLQLQYRRKSIWANIFNILQFLSVSSNSF